MVNYFWLEPALAKVLALPQHRILTKPEPADDTVSSAQLNAVRANPLVREALNLFEGTLVNVQRVAAPKKTSESADASN